VETLVTGETKAMAEAIGTGADGIKSSTRADAEVHERHMESPIGDTQRFVLFLAIGGPAFHRTSIN
jgi:hypothetical protein